MNDFDYDVLQKKRLAASARRKVNGSKSRRCSLPSDLLTPAEIKKRSGPCMSYKLNAPMDWETFKAMPDDLQQQYISGLRSRFGVGLATISVDLFAKGEPTLNAHLVRRNIKFNETGRRATFADRKRWADWLNRNDTEATVEEQPAPVCPPLEDTQAQPFGMAMLSAEWVGEFTAAEFIEQLARLPIPTGRVKIRVEVVKE